MPKKPNILCFHMHDAGRYIQPYGHAITTPVMQAAAERGTLFRDCHCVTPSCSASRSAMLTGMAPHKNGMLGLAHRGWRLNDYAKHVVTPLKEHGYTTALSGVQHVASKPLNVSVIGYDRVLTTDSGYDQASDPAIEFLGQKHDQPFFLKVAYGAPHRAGEGFAKPDQLSPPADPRYIKPPDPLPDNKTTRADMATYCDAVQGTDQAIGRVLGALEKNGHAENTIVIITTDHGIAFPEMKCNLTHHGTGVHLTMFGPGVPEGEVVDSLCTHMDVFPTVFELAGLEPCAWWEGKSLVPAMRGDAGEVHDQVFGEVTYHASYEPMRSVRTKKFLYIRRFDPRPTTLPNCDNSPSKTYMYHAGWNEKPHAEQELYDTRLDPQERCNVAGEVRYADELENLRTTLKRYMQAGNDPLLDGPVPPNDPDRVTSADNYSPRLKDAPPPPPTA